MQVSLILLTPFTRITKNKIMHISILKLIAFSALMSVSHLALSGGPRALAGPNGNTPVIYNPPSVTLHTESGDLGTRTNAEASAILQTAISMWNSPATATVDLSVNQTLLNIEADDTNGIDLIFDISDNLNPVIYDNDGALIDLFFGVNARDDTLGVSGSAWFSDSATYIEGYVLINGTKTFTDTELQLVFAHELGHFIGLDHTQVNIANNESSTGFPLACSTTSVENYPLMYPISCRTAASLHSDDASAVSALYPTAVINDNFGTFEGNFIDEDGNAILGGNIWMLNISTGETYSIVSDYLMENTGYFKFLLPAGSYTLSANSVNPEFIGGSGVGPYSLSAADLSFQNPHPITPVSYTNASGTDEVISITNGQTISNDFTINGELAATPSSTDSDENDSYADLFGATSPLFLTLFFLSLFSFRYFAKKNPNN